MLYQSSVYSLQKYLEPFLESLSGQTYPSLEILLLDNGSSEKSFLKTVQQFQQRAQPFPVRILTSDTNLGFGGGHNLLIRQSQDTHYLVLNPDMVLGPDFITELVRTMENHADAGIVTGKIYRWKSAPVSPLIKKEGKEVIDTVGLGYDWLHGFVNLGERQEDQGQYDREQEVFGASGVAMLLRRDALEKVRYGEEYFDELMFMYKEDIDLSFRLRWAGYKAYVNPQAVAYHDRSVSTVTKKSTQVEQWSYLNEKILLLKNIPPDFPGRIRFLLSLRHALKKGYAWFFARHLLDGDTKFQELLPVIRQKKEHLIRNVPSREIARWFS